MNPSSPIEQAPSQPARPKKKVTVIATIIGAVILLAAALLVTTAVLRTNADTAAKTYFTEASDYLKKAFDKKNGFDNYLSMLEQGGPTVHNVFMGEVLSAPYRKALVLQKSLAVAINATLPVAKIYGSAFEIIPTITDYTKALSYKVDLNIDGLDNPTDSQAVPRTKETTKRIDEKIRLYQDVAKKMRQLSLPEKYKGAQESFAKSLDKMAASYSGIKEQTEKLVTMGEKLRSGQTTVDATQKQNNLAVIDTLQREYAPYVNTATKSLTTIANFYKDDNLKISSRKTYDEQADKIHVIEKEIEHERNATK